MSTAQNSQPMFEGLLAASRQVMTSSPVSLVSVSVSAPTSKSGPPVVSLSLVLGSLVRVVPVVPAALAVPVSVPAPVVVVVGLAVVGSVALAVALAVAL
jgi:hypothetical protein